MLLLNFKCGYARDEYHFTFVWKDFRPVGNDRPIESLADIIKSAENYYTLSGGRVIPHTLAFLFVNMDKCIFNFFNAAVFLFLGRIIYKYAFGGKKTDIFFQASVYISLFLFLPSFGDNVIWLSGSVNYLWTGTLMLYCIYFCDKNSGVSKISTNTAMILLVLLSSSTNEITGGMLAVWLTVRLIIKKRKPDLRYIAFYLSCMIGEYIVVSAPGNFHRAEIVENVKLFDFSNLFKILISYIYNTVRLFDLNLWLIALTVLFFLKLGKIKNFISIIPLLSSAAAGICALSLTGYYTVRPLFFGAVLLIAAMWKNIKTVHDEADNEIKKRFCLLLIISCSLFLFLKLFRHFSGIFISNDLTLILIVFLLIYWIFCIYLILGTFKQKQGPATTVPNVKTINKTRFLVILSELVFLTHSTYEYFNDMDNLCVVFDVNFENHTDVNSKEYPIPKKSFITPNETFYTSICDDYTYLWRTECEKNNISCPDIKGF